ncbi:MAG: hypothetical protein K2X50_03515 [Gammaproteobacteria bacterium]|nr:hypothetical protein [Gammaproteobacteria bacterium]
MATLRQALSQRISKDPQGFYKAVKAQNINLNPQQETSLRDGNLKAFGDDKNLEKLFNTKVLGALGINTKDLSYNQKGSSSEKWNKGDESGKW